MADLLGNAMKAIGGVGDAVAKTVGDVNKAFEALGEQAGFQHVFNVIPGLGNIDKSDKNLEKMFKEIDEDGSQKISEEELKGFLNKLYGRALDDKLFNQMMNAADTNGDGEIDLEEFKVIMRAGPDSPHKAAKAADEAAAARSKEAQAEAKEAADKIAAEGAAKAQAEAAEAAQKAEVEAARAERAREVAQAADETAKAATRAVEEAYAAERMKAAESNAEPLAVQPKVQPAEQPSESSPPPVRGSLLVLSVVAVLFAAVLATAFGRAETLDKIKTAVLQSFAHVLYSKSGARSNDS